MTKTILCLATLLVGMSFNASVYADDDHSTVFGSVLGAVVGGAIGHQFGGGNGKYVTTSIGAMIGARLGQDAQQRLYEKERYHPDYAGN